MKRRLTLFATVATMAVATALNDPCASQRNKKFSSRVEVEFGMAHDKGLRWSEINELESAFIAAYNSRSIVNNNNKVNCDKTYMRKIEECEVEAYDSYFLYENGNKVYRRLFAFNCDGVCKNCDKDHNLLDWTSDTRRSLLEAREKNLESVARVLSAPPKEATKCSCKNTAAIRAPSQKEMKNALRYEINARRSKGKIKAFKTVINVFQMEAVKCSTSNNKFETTVQIKLNDNPDPKDLYAIANGFLDTYNEGTSDYCDSYHRRISSVTVREEDLVIKDRRRGLFRRIYVFRISGSCRGCKKFEKLFNDSISRRLGEPEEPVERDLAWTDTCYCPKWPLAKRVIKTSEFRPRYSRSVQETNNAGISVVKEL